MRLRRTSLAALVLAAGLGLLAPFAQASEPSSPAPNQAGGACAPPQSFTDLHGVQYSGRIDVPANTGLVLKKS